MAHGDPMFHFHPKFRTDDCGDFSFTSSEQKRVESLVSDCVENFLQNTKDDPTEPCLHVESLAQYLRSGLKHLPDSYQSLDASKNFEIFWIFEFK